MNRGYPDYFGFSMFPYFGEVLVQDQLLPLPLGPGLFRIYELNHKGVILGGKFYLGTPVWPSPVEIIITIDGAVVLQERVLDMIEWGPFSVGSSPLNVTVYNQEDSYTVHEFTREISFGQTFAVDLTIAGVNAITVLGKLVYTLIVT